VAVGKEDDCGDQQRLPHLLGVADHVVADAPITKLPIAPKKVNMNR
jgi:hypothetical protein